MYYYLIHNSLRDATTSMILDSRPIIHRIISSISTLLETTKASNDTIASLDYSAQGSCLIQVPCQFYGPSKVSRRHLDPEPTPAVGRLQTRARTKILVRTQVDSALLQIHFTTRLSRTHCGLPRHVTCSRRVALSLMPL